MNMDKNLELNNYFKLEYGMTYKEFKRIKLEKYSIPKKEKTSKKIKLVRKKVMK